jgi:hypothetical protein
MSAWPGPFTNPIASAPQDLPPYVASGTAANGFATANNIAAGLVSAPVFGFYRLVGAATSNINYPSSSNTPVGR